jgi:hypothetical protein
MATKYTIKQVGNPLDLKGKRSIVVYKIFKGTKEVGLAEYSPSIYKSQYNIYYYPSTFPKIIRDSIIARDGKRELTYNYSAGTSAKNPTAVLKQFKSRYEGTINSRLERIKKYNREKAKINKGIKKTGLTASQYEQLGKYKVYIENNKKDIKESQRKIKNEKGYILIHKQNIIRWQKKIAELKRK